MEYKEDIAHATLDIYFPILYNKFQFPYFHQHLTTDLLFEDYQMLRFRNTFTKNIYIGNNDFSDAVDGTNGPVAATPNNYSALGWASLYKFDALTGNTPNLYDILMQFYIDNINSATTLNIQLSSDLSSNNYKGLADLIAAQWDKECPNLILKNRKVVYDQDFFSKGSLIIDPEEPNNFYLPTSSDYDNSFADPLITANEFTVEPGVEANFVAGNRIVVKKGHIKAGARSHGYINPALCTSGDRLSHMSEAGGKEVTKTDTEGDSTAVKATLLTAIIEGTGGAFEPELYPNPNSGVFTLKLPPGMAQQASVEIRNLLGEMIYANPSVLQAMTKIDLSSQPKGLYYVSIISGGGVFRRAVAVQ